MYDSRNPQPLYEVLPDSPERDQMSESFESIVQLNYTDAAELAAHMRAHAHYIRENVSAILDYAAAIGDVS